MNIATKRLHLRIPAPLHKKLAKRAETAGLSLNALILLVLTHDQGQREGSKQENGARPSVPVWSVGV